MPEVSTINFTNGYQPDAGQLNDPARKGAAEIGWSLAALCAMGGYDVVLNGLSVSRVAGTMTIKVGAGVALHLNPAPVAPQGLFEVLVNQADLTSAVISNGDAFNPRIDVVSVRSVSGGLDDELVAKKGAPSAVIPIRRGGTFEVLVTEGTPAGSPVAPATPAGYTKLYQLAVPALTAVITGATLTDYRNWKNTSQQGPDDTGGWIQYVNNWVGLWSMVAAVGVQDDAGNDLSMSADADAYWPVFGRTGEPSGDTSANLYPLMNPGSREYWLTTALDKSAALVQIGGAGVEDTDWSQSADTNLTLIHTSAVAASFQLSQPINVDLRGLEVLEFRLGYTISVPFNSNSDLDVNLIHWDRSASVETTLSPTAAPDTTVTSSTDSTTTLTPAVVIEDSDALRLLLTLVFEAVADGAVITFHSFGVKVREGRGT